jgi:murein DD-endopeptidase MepM/ murein hydrolase activator NlpD
MTLVVCAPAARAADPATPATAAPTAATPAGAPAAAPAVSETRTVTLTRSQTKSVQRRVHVRADGAFGTRSRVALRRYQTTKHLVRTGRPNLQTLRAMKLPFAAAIEQELAAQARTAASAAPAPAASAATPAAPAATGYTFPIQGAWHWGEAGTFFGDRGGKHQGIDLLSACGTPLVTASAGTVKANQFQAAAGNYLVMTGTPTGEDQTYMHLQSPSPLAVGTVVAAGTPLGFVGDTGNADACHLHVELWTAPGWYTGGHPRDPKSDLVSWGGVPSR